VDELALILLICLLMPKMLVPSLKIAWSKGDGFDSKLQGKVKGSQDQLYLSGGGDTFASSLDIKLCFVNLIKHPIGKYIFVACSKKLWLKICWYIGK
jgi:hypothetical protein